MCPWSSAAWPSCGCLGLRPSVEAVWQPLHGLQPLLTSLLGPRYDRGSLLCGWDLATPDTRPACSCPRPQVPTFCAAISYPARECCCLRSWGPVTPQVRLLHDTWCPLFISLCPPAGPALPGRGGGKLSLLCPHGLAQKGPQCRPLSWSNVTAWLRCCCCVRLSATPWTAARRAPLSFVSRCLLTLTSTALVMPPSSLSSPKLCPDFFNRQIFRTVVNL